MKLPFIILIVPVICLGLCRQGTGTEPSMDGQLKEMRERAQKFYDAGDYDSGHRVIADMLEVIPGRVDLATELLGAMLKASRVDRRMNPWTAYASERLVAMYEAGMLEEDRVELVAAYDCLCVMRWSDGRLWEAWEAMQHLLELDSGNPYVHLGAARMMLQLSPPDAVPFLQSALDLVDGSSNDGKIRQILMVADRSMDPSWSAKWDGISILDPWGPGYSRAKTRNESNESILSWLKSIVAQKRNDLTRPRNVKLKGKPKKKADDGRTGAAVGRVASDDLKQEWSDLLALSPDKDPAAFDRSIRTSAGMTRTMAVSDENGMVDQWSATDLHLQQVEPATLAPLRQLQEARYKEQSRLLTPEQRAGRPGLDWYRTSPWSETANMDLLVSAQADLNRGYTEAARRSFHDVMAHSVDPSVRRSAQVGLWLSAASEDRISAVEALFTNVEAGAVFPWMGKTETAANIRTRLLKGMKEVEPDTTRLAEFQPRQLRLPAVPVWPENTASFQNGASLVDLQVCGNRILAGSRNWLALYDLADASSPLWFVKGRDLLSTPTREIRFPGKWHPAVTGTRIFTRSGDEVVPSRVQALDKETGSNIWETAGTGPAPGTRRVLKGKTRRAMVEATEFRAIYADPVVVAGCVYYLELVGRNNNPGEARLDVVCAEADDGSPIWRSTVVDPADDTVAGRHFRGVQTAVRTRGSGLTIQDDGSLYCNNAGIAARLDARDGRLEWVRVHRGGRPMSRVNAGIIEPLSAPPLVVGDQVLLLAQDGAGIAAADCRNGKLLWEQIFVQPLELVGAARDSIVVRCENRFVGLAAGTGEVRWSWPVPEDLVGPCIMREGVVIIGTGNELLALNAQDGLISERRAWPAGGQVWNYAIKGKTLVVVTDDTVPTASYKPMAVLNPDGVQVQLGPLALPLKHAWTLPRDHAAVFSVPADSPLKGRLFVAADGMLEAVDIDGGGRSAWRIFTVGTVNRVLFDKTTVVLCSISNPLQPRDEGAVAAMGVDGRTGKLLWRLPVFLGGAGVMLADGVFVMHNEGSEIRAYDASTGHLMWTRLMLQNIGSESWPMPPSVHSGQLHLFGSRLSPLWEKGVPHVRFDLQTGAMQPLKWVAKTDNLATNGRNLCYIGAREAFVHVLGNHWSLPKHVYRYSMDGGGEGREVPGGDSMWLASPPFVVVGTQDSPACRLFKCDDPAYEYKLDSQQLRGFYDGMMLYSEKNGTAIIELATKRRIATVDTASEKISNPGVIVLDDTRILFYGAGTNAVVIKEIDRQTGKISGTSSLLEGDIGKTSLRAVMVPQQSNVLIVQDSNAIHAFNRPAAPVNSQPIEIKP